MTGMKKEFLKQMVGFSKKDLSLQRQLELDAWAERRSFEWIMLALSKKSVEEWEKWGFGLFGNMEFIGEINALVKAFEKINDEDIKNEKGRKNVKGKPKIWYSEKTLQEQYDKLMKYPIGGANTEEDYMTHYGTKEAKEILAMIQAERKPLEDLDEKERWVVASSTLVRIMRITVPKRA